MRVKVGDSIYDGDNEPVMVILSDTDKRNIESMPFYTEKYASYPETVPEADIEAWMLTTHCNGGDRDLRRFDVSKAKKPEPSGMVDTAEARLWLAQYKAHVTQLAKELKTMTDAEAFAGLYRLRCRLWYEQEDYAMAGGGS